MVTVDPAEETANNMANNVDASVIVHSSDIQECEPPVSPTYGAMASLATCEEELMLGPEKLPMLRDIVGRGCPSNMAIDPEKDILSEDADEVDAELPTWREEFAAGSWPKNSSATTCSFYLSFSTIRHGNT